MKSPKKVVLNITPSTNVRTTQNDRVFFRIPRNKLRPAGLKRLLRIEKYNNYKVELLTEAKKKRFEIPPAGLSVTFFIPCPRSWTDKKKREHHGRLHQSRPDVDNLGKGFFDALIAEDKYIANITFTKRWVDFPEGWIECQIFPFDEKAPIDVPLKD
jgi:Holliday junction resolvase RusA-like endonuclease